METGSLIVLSNFNKYTHTQKGARVVWRLMNISIDVVTRILYVMFLLLNCDVGLLRESLFASRPMDTRHRTDNDLERFRFRFL